MKEYVIDAKNMDEKELNRTIKEQAISHDKLVSPAFAALIHGVDSLDYIFQGVRSEEVLCFLKVAFLIEF